MAKIAKVFRSPRERRTVGRQTVIAITQEMTSGRGVSLDIDGRQSGEGKTEHSVAGNSVGWMLRWEERRLAVDRWSGGTCSRFVEVK